jgi:hypothetical protein
LTFHTLVASDIDGTLIPEETTYIPESVYDCIREGWDRGYLFVAASGRQYPGLRRLFAPVADRMAFLFENGAGLSFQDELCYTRHMDRALAVEIARYVESLPGCSFLADWPGGSCTLQSAEPFAEHLRQELHMSVETVPDFDDLPENIMKIAVWCADGSSAYAQRFQDAYGDRTRIAVSGSNWIDFNITDKGEGLAAACRIFSIPQENTIAFGDNWNDVPMLDFAAQPYLMRTGNPELMGKYSSVCDDVSLMLKKIFEKDKKVEKNTCNSSETVLL